MHHPLGNLQRSSTPPAAFSGKKKGKGGERKGREGKKRREGRREGEEREGRDITKVCPVYELFFLPSVNIQSYFACRLLTADSNRN